MVMMVDTQMPPTPLPPCYYAFKFVARALLLLPFVMLVDSSPPSADNDGADAVFCLISYVSFFTPFTDLLRIAATPSCFPRHHYCGVTRLRLLISPCHGFTMLDVIFLHASPDDIFRYAFSPPDDCFMA